MSVDHKEQARSWERFVLGHRIVRVTRLIDPDKTVYEASDGTCHDLPYEVRGWLTPEQLLFCLREVGGDLDRYGH